MSGHSRPSTRGREVHSHTLTDRKGQVQNVKAARVYVFGDGDLAEDDSNENVVFEMPEIRVRRDRDKMGARFPQMRLLKTMRCFTRRRSSKGIPCKAYPSNILVR